MIPVRCFTCGKCIGGEVYRKYREKYIENKGGVNLYPSDKSKEIQTCPSGLSFDINEKYQTLGKIPNSSWENEVLNELGVRRYCCRRMILTHPHDLHSKIV